MDKIQLIKDTQEMELACKMVNIHKPEGILPFFYEESNKMEKVPSSTFRITYDTEGYMPLDEYLKRHILSEVQIQHFFVKILEAIQQAPKYYVPPENFLFSPENVYIKRQAEAIGFVYLPKEKEKDLENSLMHFIRLLIYEHIRAEDSMSPTLIKIANGLKEPGWHIKGLLYALNENKEPEINKQDEKEKVTLEKCDAIPEKRTHKESSTSSKQIFQEPSKNIKEKVAKEDKSFQKKESSKWIVVVCGLLCGGLIGLFFVVPLGLDKIQKIGMLLLIGVGGVVIYRCLPQTFKKRKFNGKPKFLKKKVKKGNYKINKNLEEENDFLEKPIVESSAIKSSIAKNSLFEENAEASSLKVAERTALLPRGKGRCFLKTPEGREVVLQKERILIGRDAQSVDICVQKSLNVGRHHAELIKIESGYAVKDLESVNGTYVGDLKVRPKEAVALIHGDILRLADVGYTFYNWT